MNLNLLVTFLELDIVSSNMFNFLLIFNFYFHLPDYVLLISLLAIQLR